MKFILNIGLDSKATRSISADVAAQIVVANDFLIRKSKVLRSDTEPTLVCEVVAMPSSPFLVIQQLRQIAVDLHQDCIAVFRPRTGKGVLIGPNAQAWGKFNPEFFFTLDGQRLAEEQACRPSNVPA